MGELDEARKMLLVPRAEWCASELERSARELADNAEHSDEIRLAAEGTGLMAATMRELLAEAARAARCADNLTRSSRFLLDMLQADNATVEARYGRTDTLEQAAIELRSAINAWREDG